MTTGTDRNFFVHPLGLCESEDIGEGTRIWAFAHVMAGATLGKHCNVCDHSFIESGVTLGNRVTVKNAVLIWDRVSVADDVFLGPNMVFTNDLTPRATVKKNRDQLLPTIVERGATIGANATIVCGVTIGSWAFVAAGAVVIKSVPAHALMVGNPARRVGWSCNCGDRLGADLRCSCGRIFEPTDTGIREQVTETAQKAAQSLNG